MESIVKKRSKVRGTWLNHPIGFLVKTAQGNQIPPLHYDTVLSLSIICHSAWKVLFSVFSGEVMNLFLILIANSVKVSRKLPLSLEMRKTES